MSQLGELYIDVGSSALTGIYYPLSGEVPIIAKTPSRGILRGRVADVREATASFVEIAEQMRALTKKNLTECTLVLGSDNISSKVTRGDYPITPSGRDGVVTGKDLEQVIKVASVSGTGHGKEILHTLAQRYEVDGQSFASPPLGVRGVRLSVICTLILGARSAVHSHILCANSAGLAVKELVLGSLAASEVILSRGARERGALVLDIGEGKTQIHLWQNGVTVFIGGTAVAGGAVTSDIAKVFGVPLVHAELWKKENGTAWAKGLEVDAQFPLPHGAVSPTASASELSAVITDRVEELFDITLKKIKEAGLTLHGTSVYLIGGGALLPGIDDLAQEKLSLPVQIGFSLRPEQMRLFNMRTYPAQNALFGAAQYCEERSKVFSTEPVYEGARASETHSLPRRELLLGEGSQKKETIHRILRWLKSFYLL